MDINFLSRFIKGVISTSLGLFIQIVLGFVGLMIAARFVLKEEFGVFILIQVIATLFGILSTLALEGISVTKFITNVKEKDKVDIVNTALSFKILISVMMCFFIFLCKPLIHVMFKSEQLSQLFIYIPIFFILNSLNEILLNILQGFHQYRKMAISQVINGVFRLFFIIVFLIVLKMSVIGLICAFLFSFTASVLFQFLVIPVKKKFNFSLIIYKKILKFGFPLGLNSVLTFIFTRIDRFMIGAMISPLGVAHFEIASRIPDSSRRMFESFRAVYFPNISELFAKKKYTEAENVLNASLRLISFLTIFVALVALLFQKEIICLLFSDRYLESAPTLSILMLSLSIGLIGNVLGTSLVAFGQSDKPAKINLVNTITNVVGNVIMIPIFGFIGAAYAALISRCATNPLNVWFLKKAGIRVEISQYLKPIIVFGVPWFLFVFFKPENIIIKLSLLISFFIFCILLSIIKKKDISVLFEGIRPSAHAIK